jgi:hypothetical protein
MKLIAKEKCAERLAKDLLGLLVPDARRMLIKYGISPDDADTILAIAVPHLKDLTAAVGITDIGRLTQEIHAAGYGGKYEFSGVKGEKSVTVMNLSTGEEYNYLVDLPSKAVVWAHEYARGNRSTWTYDQRYKDLYPKLVWGNKTVGLGDFVALRGSEEPVTHKHIE